MSVQGLPAKWRIEAQAQHLKSIETTEEPRFWHAARCQQLYDCASSLDAALRQNGEAVAWPAKYFCDGPEGAFFTDDSSLANKLICATFDRGLAEAVIDAARAVAADQTRDPDPGTPLARLDAALAAHDAGGGK